MRVKEQACYLALKNRVSIAVTYLGPGFTLEDFDRCTTQINIQQINQATKHLSKQATNQETDLRVVIMSASSQASNTQD